MIHLRRDLGRWLLALLLCLAAPGAAAAADILARSDRPQAVSGEGDRVLLIDGPFAIEWQSGGRIGVTATPLSHKAQSGGPAALSGPGADGVAKGRMKLSDQWRYRVSIEASGPWEMTVTW